MRTKRVIAAGLMLLGIAGLALAGQQAASGGNALCPNLCLLGGGSGGGSGSATVAGVEKSSLPVHLQVGGMRADGFGRTYDFNLILVNASGGVPEDIPSNGSLHVEANPSGNGVGVLSFDGNVIGLQVTVSDNGVLTTIKNKGGSDQLQLIVENNTLIGPFTFSSPNDPYNCDDGDDHSNNDPIGHLRNTCNPGHD